MRILALALILTVASCGGPEPTGNGDTGSEERDNEEQETVFDPLVGTIDTARKVEDQVMGQKRQLDEALREAENDDGGDSRDRSD
jgi:hypothetical protein